MTVRRLQERRGFAYSLSVGVIKPALLATTRRTWIDGSKIPASGGCVVALNHVSPVDPLTAAHLLYDHGRLPRYLAKASLFRHPAMDRFLRNAGQIPVDRGASGAEAYAAAVEAVRDGQCVVVYPEGSITRDPDGWPMRGKSGAARIGLATGCPVLPVGQWGAQALVRPYVRTAPSPFPPKPVTMKVGDPVDLDDLVGDVSAPAVATATDRIMAAITGLVEEIRGERAPAERFDPRRAGVSEFGNPHERPRTGAEGDA